MRQLQGGSGTRRAWQTGRGSATADGEQVDSMRRRHDMPEIVQFGGEQLRRRYGDIHSVVMFARDVVAAAIPPCQRVTATMRHRPRQPC